MLRQIQHTQGVATDKPQLKDGSTKSWTAERFFWWVIRMYKPLRSSGRGTTQYQGTSWQMLTMFCWESIRLTSIDNLHSITGCFMMGSFISWRVNNPQQSMGAVIPAVFHSLYPKKSTKVKCPLLTKQPSQECKLSVMSVGRILLCSSKALLEEFFLVEKWWQKTWDISEQPNSSYDAAWRIIPF